LEDLERLVTLMKYLSDHHDRCGLDTLYDLVINKTPFDDAKPEIENASEGGMYILNTLFEIEATDGTVLGKSKLSMEGLFRDLLLLLERCEIFIEAQAEEQPDP
jgi:hypothetical protein